MATMGEATLEWEQINVLPECNIFECSLILFVNAQLLLQESRYSTLYTEENWKF